MDYGVHPPTIYFPLIVKEALMIEPTETESKESIDNYCDVLLRINEEIEKDPETVKTAPHTTVVGRLDDVFAARKMILRWSPALLTDNLCNPYSITQHKKNDLH